MDAPAHLDLDKARGLTITWPDGAATFYPIAYLRRMSPSAEARDLREKLARNPLTVLPSNPAQPAPGAAPAPLTALSAELVGNYALRIRFSDGHSTGLYSWKYLREIAPADQPRPR